MTRINTEKLIKKQQEDYAVRACTRYFKMYGEIDKSSIDQINIAVENMQIKNEDQAFSIITLNEEALNLLTK